MSEKIDVVLTGPAKVGDAYLGPGATAAVSLTEYRHLVEAGAAPEGHGPATATDALPTPEIDARLPDGSSAADEGAEPIEQHEASISSVPNASPSRAAPASIRPKRRRDAPEA